MKLEIIELPDSEVEQTICLNMIVKNESHIIVNTLQNICDNIHITYWVISDTGSTDNTKELIQEFFNKKNIAGEIFDDEWQDFGSNRTIALDHAYNKTDYLFIFDADDLINGTLKFPDKLDKDMYKFKFGDGGGAFVYNRPLMINNRKRFMFKGVLHEYLVALDSKNEECLLEGDYYISSGKSGARSKDPNKYKNDAEILVAAIESGKEPHLKERYTFYCAQSYKDAGNHNKSIEWYKKCLDKNWVQERYYAAMQIGILYAGQGEMEKALYYWLKTMDYDMERIEGIVLACKEYQKMGSHNLVIILYEKFKNYTRDIDILSNKLFLDKTQYQSTLEHLASISAAYSFKPELGYSVCANIIINNFTNKVLVSQTLWNLQFYLKYYTEKNSLELFHAVDIFLTNDIGNPNPVYSKLWQFLFDKVRPRLVQDKKVSIQNRDKPTIMITFTTCKRYDLFKQTINSLLNQWHDYDKIDYWYCVDDNSSDEDRKKMRDNYPWIDYYMKKKHRKKS